jgi:hypothetical protein
MTPRQLRAPVVDVFAPCPHCGAVPTECDLFLDDEDPGRAVPQSGDATLCETCFLMSIYETNGTRRVATPPELRVAIRRIAATYGATIAREIAVAAVFGVRHARTD